MTVEFGNTLLTRQTKTEVSAQYWMRRNQPVDMKCLEKNATNLKAHVRIRHPSVYAEFEKEDAAKRQRGCAGTVTIMSLVLQLT